MTARNCIARPLRLAALAMAPGSLCVGTPVIAHTRAGVSISAGGSVESNPYLVNGGTTDVSGNLEVQPWLQLSSDVSSLNLVGDVTLRQYSKGANGTDISGTLGLAGSHRLSPYFTVNGGVNYQTSRNGINQGFSIVGHNDPAPPLTTPLPDISLAGTRTRTQSVSVNMGFSARLSARDQLGASFTAMHSGYSSGIATDSNYFNAGVNYARALSERISATASVRYARSDYLHTNVGDGTIITPEAGVDVTLGPFTKLSGSLGMSFSNSELANGAKAKSHSLSFSARLCRSGERSAMCLVAARTAQPTAFNSIDAVTSVSLVYNKRMSAQDTVDVSLSYNTNKSASRLLAGPEKSQYYDAGGTWSHNFSRRFSAYLSPSYSRIKDFSRSYNSFKLSAGLRYSFGAIS